MALQYHGFKHVEPASDGNRRFLRNGLGHYCNHLRADPHLGIEYPLAPGAHPGRLLFAEQRRKFVEGSVKWKIYRAGRWAMAQPWYRPLTFALGVPQILIGLKLLGWL